jgi:hypothetical protein
MAVFPGEVVRRVECLLIRRRPAFALDQDTLLILNANQSGSDVVCVTMPPDHEHHPGRRSRSTLHLPSHR